MSRWTGRHVVCVGIVAALVPVVTSAVVGLGPSPAQAATEVSFGGGDLQALVPSRLLDTREGSGAPVGPGGEVQLQVGGRGGVPVAGVGAVVLNVTVTGPTQPGFITVYPTGGERPLASNLNYAPGSTVPNLVVAKLGTGGRVTLFNSAGNSHLVADVSGWFPEGSGLQSMNPVRVLDTREGNGVPQGPVGAGATVALQVAGRAGVPLGGVGAVVLNVTVTGPTTEGFVTVFPHGEPLPLASSLNFVPGQTVPNLVIAKVGSGGAVDLFNSSGMTHLVADIAGWFPAEAAFQSVTPNRLLDTRVGLGAPAARVAPGGVVALRATGQATIPSTGVGAVVLNVTVTEPASAGYVTVWPHGVERPVASNLNMATGQTVPNLVVVKVGAGGLVDLFTQAETHLIADVVGWFPDSSTAATTMQLAPGTVLLGAGDIVEAHGGAETGGVLILAGDADGPQVGGHVAVMPNALVPFGAFGLVTEIHGGVHGTVTVVYIPAVLEAGIPQLETHATGGRAGLFTSTSAVGPRSPASASAASVDCGAGGGGPGLGPVITPIFDVDLGNGVFEFDLAARHLRVLVPVTLTFGLTATITGTVSCTLEFPPVMVVIGPLVVDVIPKVTLSISATITAQASVTTTMQLGVQVDGSSITNLSEFQPVASGSVDATAEAVATLRPSLEVDLTAFGIAGGFIDFGVNLSGIYAPNELPCGRFVLQATVEAGIKVGRWGLEWTATLAELKFPELELWSRSIGCPNVGGVEAWRGTMSVHGTHTIDNDVLRETDTEDWQLRDTSLNDAVFNWTGSITSSFTEECFFNPGTSRSWQLAGSGAGTVKYSLRPDLVTSSSSFYGYAAGPEGNYAIIDRDEPTQADLSETAVEYQLVSGTDCNGEPAQYNGGNFMLALNLPVLIPVTTLDPNLAGVNRLERTYQLSVAYPGELYVWNVTVKLSRSLVDSDGDGIPDDVE